MQLKLSEGQDESKVTAEVTALVESGWNLDEEQIGVRKTYHFKTYTKVMVSGSTSHYGQSYICRICIIVLVCEASPETITQK